MTKRTSIVCTAALALVASPAALASTPKPDAGSPYACVPKSVGFKAAGKLISSALTQSAGADTAERGDDRYSGEIIVDVARTNHKGSKGQQTYALAGARVKFHPRKDTQVAAGDRVKLTGKVTRVGKKCDSTGFEATVTVRKVDVKAARTPKTT